MLQLIGEGNTAEVFAWKETEVLKLFREGFPKDGAEQEFRINREIEKYGIPMPRVIDMLEYEGRPAIIYERITGTSLLDLISRHPLRAVRYTKHMAKLQYEFHQVKAEALPSAKSELVRKIQRTKELPEKIKERILLRLEQLPEGEALYHGDYHPGNIMVASGRYVILDWMLGAGACPCADVARTLMLLKDAALPDTMPKAVKSLIRRMRNHLAGSYLKEYCRLSGRDADEIRAWRLPIIAARLTEWIPENEKQALLGEIKETMVHTM